jgi:hypothetical protein
MYLLSYWRTLQKICTQESSCVLDACNGAKIEGFLFVDTRLLKISRSQSKLLRKCSLVTVYEVLLRVSAILLFQIAGG